MYERKKETKTEHDKSKKELFNDMLAQGATSDDSLSKDISSVVEEREIKIEEKARKVEQIMETSEKNLLEQLHTLKHGCKNEEEKLKKYYKETVLYIHPDKCSHPKAEEAFKKFDEAYKKALKKGISARVA